MLTAYMLPALAALTLAGCVTAPTPEMVANANYGARPPATYKQLIQDDVNARLIDPTSPLYTFENPMKGYIMVTPKTPHFGWLVCGTVNSKNRMGGYAGKVPYYGFFREGELIAVKIGENPTGEYGFSYVNGLVNSACNSRIQ